MYIHEKQANGDMVTRGATMFRDAKAIDAIRDTQALLEQAYDVAQAIRPYVKGEELLNAISAACAALTAVEEA